MLTYSYLTGYNTICKLYRIHGDIIHGTEVFLQIFDETSKIGSNNLNIFPPPIMMGFSPVSLFKDSSWLWLVVNSCQVSVLNYRVKLSVEHQNCVVLKLTKARAAEKKADACHVLYWDMCILVVWNVIEISRARKWYNFWCHVNLKFKLFFYCFVLEPND